MAPRLKCIRWIEVTAIFYIQSKGESNTQTLQTNAEREAEEEKHVGQRRAGAASMQDGTSWEAEIKKVHFTVIRTVCGVTKRPWLTCVVLISANPLVNWHSYLLIVS